MPPARTARARVVNNENDENSGTTRLTRAKSAALTTDDASSGPTKKTLQSKKSAANTAVGNGAGRKRAALGDVSNVNKSEQIDGKDLKKASIKAGLVSKSQNAGVQKLTRTNSSRKALGAKDNNKKSTVTELKRPASGSGMGNLQKKRVTNASSSSTVSAREDEEGVSQRNISPKKKTFSLSTEERVTVTRQETVEIEVQPEEQTTAHDDVKSTGSGYVPDLDAEDIGDPLMVSEYVVEIFEYLGVLEEATMPNHKYMDHQSNIEWKMRGILVDWLIEVHTRFHLLPETLFLAINIIDRFLSVKVVQLDRLQLVGVTAMFIASKYEEVLSPHVANFVHVTDDGFSEEEILGAERYILAALNYDLSYPNPMNFLRRISKADNYDIQTRTLGKYLLEISLLDHRFLSFPPSHVSAASMYLARLILGRGEWDAALTHYSGYDEAAIEPVLSLLIDYLAAPVAHEAFFKKYASKKFLKASIVARAWTKSNVSKFPLHSSVANI